MTWKLLGIDRASGSGIEVALPAEFTDDTVIGWLTPEGPLHGRLWKVLETQATDYYVMCGISWRVDVFSEDHDQHALTYRLPSSFGYVDAARWTGTRHLDVYGGEYELGEQQVTELGEILDVHVNSEQYAYFLGATGDPT